MDGAFSDGLEEVRIARTTQTAIPVEVGDNPRGVFHGLLVVIATVLGNFVREVGVGAKRVLGNVGLDRVTRVGGEAVIHVAELASTMELFILVMAAWDTGRIQLHVDVTTAGGREVSVEVLRPVNGSVGNNGSVHVSFLGLVDFFDKSETVGVGLAFEFAGFPQLDRDVVVFDQAGFGQVDLLFDGDFADFLAFARTSVVPSAEVQHVALGAVGETRTASAGGELGVEAFSLELGDEFLDFRAARRSTLLFFDGPVVVILASRSCHEFFAPCALGELSTAHTPGTESREVRAGAAPESTTAGGSGSSDETG